MPGGLTPSEGLCGRQVPAGRGCAGTRSARPGRPIGPSGGGPCGSGGGPCRWTGPCDCVAGPRAIRGTGGLERSEALVASSGGIVGLLSFIYTRYMRPAGPWQRLRRCRNSDGWLLQSTQIPSPADLVDSTGAPLSPAPRASPRKGSEGG